MINFLDKKDDIKFIKIGMGEYFIGPKTSTVIIASNLGSCVGVTLYDQINHIGGMVHIVLPNCPNLRSTKNLFKYADTGIPLFVEKICQIGAKKSFLISKIAGGSQMFNNDESGSLNVGLRNVEAVIKSLKELSIKIVSTDVGGNYSRTLKLFLENGLVTIKIPGDEEERIL